MNDEKRISVWLDETSEPGNPSWIISECKDGDNDTLDVFPADDREGAIERGRELAAQRGLPLVECNKYGVETAIA